MCLTSGCHECLKDDYLQFDPTNFTITKTGLLSGVLLPGNNSSDFLQRLGKERLFWGKKTPLHPHAAFSTTVQIAWSSIRSVYNERISNPQTTVPIVSAVTQEVSFTPRQNLSVLTQFSHLSEKDVSVCVTGVSKGGFRPSLKPTASSLLRFISQHCTPESKLPAQTP